MGLQDVITSFFGGMASQAPQGYGSATLLANQQMDQITADDIARFAEYDNNLRAYNGMFPDPLLHEPADTWDTVRLNKIKPIINTSVYFLFGTPPTFEIPEAGKVGQTATAGDQENGPKRSEMEIWLDECLVFNKWPGFLLDEGTNGATHGTPYVKFLPIDIEAGQIYPRIQVLDPRDMTIKTDPRDIEHVLAYIWQYNTLDKNMEPITVRQRIEEQDDRTWTIYDEHTTRTGGGWILDGVTPWPYTWAPIHHCKNLPAPNEVYGDSDITQTLIETNRAVNFNYSNWNRINKHHAHPKVYLIGNHGVPAVLVKLGPNAIWDIPDTNAKVGQLVPAIDGNSITALVDRLESQMLEESQTPAVAIGVIRDQRDVNLSGVALRVKMWPILMKTEVKRALYEPWVVEILSRLLELGGQGVGIRPVITWRPLLPVDPLVERQVALIDKQLGVSESTLLEQLGYDYSVEHPLAQAEAMDDMALQAQGMAMQGGMGAQGAGQAGGGQGGLGGAQHSQPRAQGQRPPNAPHIPPGGVNTQY